MAFRQDKIGDFSGAATTNVTANMVCMLSMLTWAAGFPAAEMLLDTWNPLALIAARFAIAVTFLVPVWAMIEGPEAVLRARWGRASIVGGIGFGAGAYLILLGQSISDPVTVTIVAASMPAVAAGLEVLFDGRKLRLPFVLGIALAIVGGLIATGANIREGSTGLGALLALVSVVLFGWGSRAAVKDFPELTVLGQTTATLAGGMVFTGVTFGIVWMLGLSSGISAPVDNTQLGYLILYALGSMALSQLLWIMGIGRLGIALAAVHINAAPFYVMLLVVAMGGLWNWWQAFGAALVGLGVVVSQRRRI